jgi:ribosome-associated protein
LSAALPIFGKLSQPVIGYNGLHYGPHRTLLFSQGEHLQGKALQDFIVDKIDDLKGQDIIAIDVQGKSSITDCMVICTGTSNRHVMSIAEHVVESARKEGMDALGVKGINATDWVVVDLGEIIVHVMQEESRQLYELEKLWS